MAHRFIVGENSIDWQFVVREDQHPSGQHGRRYIAPVNNEVELLMPSRPVENREIVLQLSDDECPTLSVVLYDPVQHPLLFPYRTNACNVYCTTGRRRRRRRQGPDAFHWMVRTERLQFYQYWRIQHLRTRKAPF